MRACVSADFGAPSINSRSLALASSDFLASAEDMSPASGAVLPLSFPSLAALSPWARPSRPRNAIAFLRSSGLRFWAKSRASPWWASRYLATSAENASSMALILEFWSALRRTAASALSPRRESRDFMNRRWGISVPIRSLPLTLPSPNWRVSPGAPGRFPAGPFWGGGGGGGGGWGGGWGRGAAPGGG